MYTFLTENNTVHFLYFVFFEGNRFCDSPIVLRFIQYLGTGPVFLCSLCSTVLAAY